MSAAPAAVSRRGALLAPWLLPARARAAESQFFQASDGTRLHYLLAGRGGTVVLVPGWSMPAWIWDAQLQALSRRYRVVAFDPRGQGRSEVAATGYEPRRRGQDIGDLLDHLSVGQAVLAGWSLGVLDTLAYLHESGDSRIAGLVLVDNSIGEDPPPAGAGPRAPMPPAAREEAMRRFVRGMFRHPPPQATLDRLTEDALRLPPAASRALLSYPVPRSYWREAVYSTTRPVLYVVRPRFAGQAANLAARHPAAETAIFAEAGHALFVDEAERFNRLVADFIQRRIWP